MNAIPFPPEDLRFRVSNSRSEEEFDSVGKRCAIDIAAAVSKAGQDMSKMSSILDFGSGPGRTLRSLIGAGPKLVATDIDEEAISWLRGTLNIESTVNGHEPPLAFPNDRFDLVYAVSVFSHMNLTRARMWLEDIARVTKRGGLLVLSICGPAIFRAGGNNAAALDHYGTIFQQVGYWDQYFPEWYGDMFFTEDGARKFFGKSLEFIEYTYAGMNGHQDLVTLRKPS